jgi:hypothetical protein
VIKNSQQEDLRAHHPDAPSDNDRTGLKWTPKLGPWIAEVKV